MSAAALTPETNVRINVRQLVGTLAFIAANTTGVALYFDRRMASIEHAHERQADRIVIVEKAQESLDKSVSYQIEKQNAKLDRLTDAINTLAVNVAALGAREKAGGRE